MNEQGGYWSFTEYYCTIFEQDLNKFSEKFEQDLHTICQKCPCTKCEENLSIGSINLQFLIKIWTRFEFE